MKTLNLNYVSKNSSEEKERLEIIEKKVDIQKKRHDIRKDKYNLSEIEKRKMCVEEHASHISKILYLSFVLESRIIDEERTIFGSEPFLKPTFEKQEREVLKSKIFELIKKI